MQAHRRKLNDKTSFFNRPEVKGVLEMVESMGFSKNMAKKAILRVGVAEPNAVVEALLSGRFSDDEEGVE